MNVFKTSDFPSPDDHEFSLYRGVLVQWDEDHDERVLRVIDYMPAKVVDRLLVVQEHEGSVAFVWDRTIPVGYEVDGPGIDVPGGDWWYVYSSVALPDHPTKGTPTSYRKEVTMTQKELDLLAALEKEAHEEAAHWKYAAIALADEYSPEYCRLHQAMEEAKEKALHNALAELQGPRTQEELP